jgi:predicted PurR-regulated permease PerM
MPRRVDIRCTALTTLVVLAALMLMRAAADFFVPLVVSVLVAYALEPFVWVVVRCHVPRGAAAAIVLLLVLAAAGSLGYAMSGQAAAALERLPTVTDQIRRELRRTSRGDGGPIRAIEEAAADIEGAARDASQRTPAPRTPGVGRVEIVEAPLRLRPSLFRGSVGAIGVAGQIVMFVFFVYFALATGDRLREKLIRLGGEPSSADTREQVLNEINRSVEHFLLIVLATDVLVGVASWLAFSALGLRQAAAWALLAGVANTIPYFGSAVAACIFFGVALVQFGTLSMAAVVAMVLSRLPGWKA